MKPIYWRLFEMRQMDRDKDGMVSKDEFLAMVAKLWDAAWPVRAWPHSKSRCAAAAPR